MDLDHLETGQIIDQLAILVDAGRVAGKISVDGIPSFDTDAQAIVEPVQTEYDTLGFSTEMSEYGAVEIAAVNARMAEWRDGDKHQKAIAESQYQRYVFPIPGREYTDEQYYHMDKNSQWLWGAFGLTQFRHFNPQFLNTETGEKRNRLNLSSTEKAAGHWIKNPNYRTGPIIHNCAMVSNGDYTNPRRTDWEQVFGSKVAEKILAIMDSMLQRAYKKAERDKKFPDRVDPQPGPGR